MDVFSKLAPFIQDFIYSNRWTELRPIQVAACKIIFDTKDDLLLSSGTASGKTEAAFLPVLTELTNNPSTSVGALYISPLKALINDQFKRLDQMLLDSNIPVYKWHGDASQTKKNELLKKPSGILQITPESLESLLINKRGSCIKLFQDLRYIIIDEVHHFMRDVRGVQVLSQLERITKLIGYAPRRIGLSATLGDIDLARSWMQTGTFRSCQAPIVEDQKKQIRLHVERFVRMGDASTDYADSGDQRHYEFLYQMTLDKKTIVFTNSREETELVLANLKQIASKHKSPDVYRVHHGNVSALLREQTEDEMKLSEDKIVTGATVTLELGIDIGSLDQAVQVGSPITVSSFAQRLGRCGRRGQIPQLLFTFIEDVQTDNADVLGPINWSFIRLLAIVELYTKERWIEPILPHKHPYSLLYHQTMSHLRSNGELSAAKLASDMLSMACFKHISQDDYRLMLQHLLEIEHIEETELGGLIVGRKGEAIVNHYQFYTVFIVPEYYLVKDENRSIGTVDKIYPEGHRFALAGMTWETVAVNVKAKVIFVKKVPGISVVDWDVDFESELHTVLVRRMRSILKGDLLFPYISESSTERLNEIRYLARHSGILEELVTPLSEHKYAIFPWIGTRQLFTLHFALLSRGIKSNLPWRTAIYLEVIFRGSTEELEVIVFDLLEKNLDLNSLPLPDDIQIKNKYNEFVPPKLLRKQFILDFLDFDGLKQQLSDEI